MTRRRSICCCDQPVCCAATSVAIAGSWSIHFRSEDVAPPNFGWFTAASQFATDSSMIVVNPAILQAAQTVRSNSEVTGPECRYQYTPPPVPQYVGGNPFLNNAKMRRADFPFNHSEYRLLAYAEPFRFPGADVYYEAGFLLIVRDPSQTFGTCNIFLGRIARPSTGSCPWGPYGLGDNTDPDTRYRGLARIHSYSQSSNIQSLGDPSSSLEVPQIAYDEDGNVTVS